MMYDTYHKLDCKEIEAFDYIFQLDEELGELYVDTRIPDLNYATLPDLGRLKWLAKKAKELLTPK